MTKKDLQTKGQLIKGFGTQVVFCSVLPVAGNVGARNVKIMQMNTRL